MTSTFVTKGFVALAALCGAVWSATAADMAVKAPLAPVPMAYNWNGFYVGAQGGYGWGQVAASEYFANGVLELSHSFDLSGGFGGGTVGLNYVVAPHVLLGLEGDASGADIRGSTSGATAFGAATGTFRIDGFATLRGRAGVVWDNVLVYGTGGVGWFDEVSNRTITAATGRNLALIGQNAGFATTPDGWVAGGGVEWGFAPNWSAKVEYQYYDFGDSRFTAPGALAQYGSFHNDEHTVKAGLNYRFNLGSLGGPAYGRY